MVQRKHIRYQADVGTSAHLDFAGDLTLPFHAKYHGLIVEESQGGCGLVVLDKPEYKPGAVFRVKVGNLHVLKAELKWVRELEPTILRIGMQYLE